MKKPYDTTPVEMDTAEEPALAYAYTGGEVRGAGCDVGALHATPVIGTDYKSAPAEFELTAEQIELLDERLEGIEDGTAVFVPWEGTIEKLRQELAQRRKKRKAMLEYA